MSEQKPARKFVSSEERWGAPATEQKNLPAPISPLMDAFNVKIREARAYAGSSLVPENMRSSENALAAMMMADEMGENRLAVMQNLYFVQGRPGWITAFMIARVNRAHKFKGPLRWRTKQKDAENIIVECYAKLPDSDEEVFIEIDLKTAIENGWTTYKKDNKIFQQPRWSTPTMIEQMLRWRTASWLIRLYAPEVMMGLPTKEELEDISGSPGTIDMPPIQPPTLKDFTDSKPAGSVDPEPKPSEVAAVRTVDEAGSSSEDDAGLPEAANPRQVSPTPQSSVEAEHGVPPVRSPAAVSQGSPPLRDVPPPPEGASYALPMAMTKGKPDLHKWVGAALLPALLKATTVAETAMIQGDNHENIDAYRATLPPLEKAAFDGELKRIAEELAR